MCIPEGMDIFLLQFGILNGELLKGTYNVCVYFTSGLQSMLVFILGFFDMVGTVNIIYTTLAQIVYCVLWPRCDDKDLEMMIRKLLIIFYLLCSNY